MHCRVLADPVGAGSRYMVGQRRRDRGEPLERQILGLAQMGLLHAPRAFAVDVPIRAATRTALLPHRKRGQRVDETKGGCARRGLPAPLAALASGMVCARAPAW